MNGISNKPLLIADELDSALTEAVQKQLSEEDYRYQRALELVKAILPAIRSVREAGEASLSNDPILRYMSYPAFCELYMSRHLTVDDRCSMQQFLHTIPAYDDSKDFIYQSHELTVEFAQLQLILKKRLKAITVVT